MSVKSSSNRHCKWRRLHRDFHRDDCGTVAMTLPIGIVFFIVVGGFVFNAGRTVGGKIETQNAADSATFSTSVVIARGMNAITASNHLIGELNAIYVIHHSFGGKWLDEKGVGEENNTLKMRAATATLKGGYEFANGVPQKTPIPLLNEAYNQVKKIPSADVNSTLYEARLRLKRLLTTAYYIHGAAFITYAAGEKIAATPLGAAMMAGALISQLAALATEAACLKEHLVLTAIEKLCHSLKSFKKQIPTLFIGGVHNIYQKAAYEGIPLLAAKSGNEMAMRHDMIPIPDNLLISGLAQLLPKFPVVKEDTTNDQRSQLMRATYPWVAYWRHNITSVLRSPFHLFGAPLSGAANSFDRWTDKYSLQACEWLRTNQTMRNELTIVNYGDAQQSGSGMEGKSIHLYVVDGLNETNGKFSKSQEVWNKWDNRSRSSTEIEKLFCHIGFVRSEQPKISVRNIFRQENPRGIVCYAQAMVYNSNPQQRPAPSGAGGSSQPQVGWDTLGWTGNAIEYPGKMSGRPRIKLNWQAKLTPITPEMLLRTSQILLVDEHVYDTFWGSRESLLILNNH